MTAERSRPLVEERRREILRMLHAQDRLTVDQLVRHFAVSAVTVRSDLAALEAAVDLVRAHGGALRVDGLDLPLDTKARRHHAEKVRIGAAAAALIRDGETIIIDSGSTAAQVARHIRYQDLQSLTVVTSALDVGAEMTRLPHVRVVVLGGLLRHVSQSTVGPPAEEHLGRLNADHLFLGVDAIDIDAGLSTPDVLEARLNALMIRVSRHVTLVADASKFMRRSLSVIAPLASVHRVITDDAADAATLARLRERGVDVVVV